LKGIVKKRLSMNVTRIKKDKGIMKERSLISVNQSRNLAIKKKGKKKDYFMIESHCKS
jgi:hypothetical protein